MWVTSRLSERVSVISLSLPPPSLLFLPRRETMFFSFAKEGDAPTRPVEVRPSASNQRLAIRTPGCHSVTRLSSACFSLHLSTLCNTAVSLDSKTEQSGSLSLAMKVNMCILAHLRSCSCSLSAPRSKQTVIHFKSC